MSHSTYGWTSRLCWRIWLLLSSNGNGGGDSLLMANKERPEEDDDSTTAGATASFCDANNSQNNNSNTALKWWNNSTTEETQLNSFMTYKCCYFFPSIFKYSARLNILLVIPPCFFFFVFLGQSTVWISPNRFFVFYLRDWFSISCRLLFSFPFYRPVTKYCAQLEEWKLNLSITVHNNPRHWITHNYTGAARRRNDKWNKSLLL